MDRFVIQGGRRLEGTVRINGSKNAALPLMAAALLTDQPVTLRGVPGLADIGNLQLRKPLFIINNKLRHTHKQPPTFQRGRFPPGPFECTRR